jgi:hypothetical protein
MKIKITIILLAMFYYQVSMAQVGIGTTTPNANAALDLVSTSQGMLFPRMTSTQRDAIASPAKGLTIFNTALNCIQTNVGSSAAPNWKCFAGISSSSNGTAIVSAYTCSFASAGTLTAGTSVSGVTQTITAMVTSAGTYSISATANGVTFSGTGTFTGIGAQNIVLTATGTPTYGTTDDFTLNTTPNCTFNRTATGNASTNGTAIVSAYNNSSATGTLIVGSSASGVTQTITANVTTIGTYSISATANGVKFANAGTFSSTGSQNVILTATGTPIYRTTNDFTLNTTPNYTFSKYASITGCYANVAGTIKDFLCYNLGVTGTQDPFTYQSGNNNGGLYQWGRTTDGHQVTTSALATGPISSPWISTSFISNSTDPYDWRNPQSGTLWGDGTIGTDPNKGSNDPCPTGFKVPSQAQWGGLYQGGTTTGGPGTATQNTWTWTGNGYALSPIGAITPVTLFLPAAGWRGGTIGSTGKYWSSTINGTGAYYTNFTSTSVNPGLGNFRSLGCSIRCIAIDNPSTGGTSVVSEYTCNNASAGTLTLGTAVSSVTQTITAIVTTAGTYNISSTANGLTFAGAGTFSGTGSQNIVLTATGTPTAAGTHTFTLNTTPNCDFSRTTITVPGAPTSPVATAGNTQASVAFVAPVSNGGSAITGYTVTSSPGGLTATGASSPLIVTGLTNGTAYTFTVVANNAAGSSVASAASAAVTLFLCGTSTVTFTYKGTSVTYGTVSSAGGKCWLDRNLGASRVATSSTDALSYGDLFQWGRGSDGHQIRTSGTTTTRSPSDVPGHANFIRNNTNWRTTMNDNLWQGVNGVNNPCPNGYRVPTTTELSNELGSWSSANQAGAYSSPLKLPADGDRHGGNGTVNAGGYGNYWSSNVITNSNAYYLNINASSYIDSWSRSWGMPIRCIKD